MGDPPAKQNKKVNMKGILKLEKRGADTVVSFEPLDFVHDRRCFWVNLQSMSSLDRRKPVSAFRDKKEGGRLFCTFFTTDSN
jgi:hypothetical protein